MVVAGARAHFGLSRHAARLSGQKRPQPAPVFPHTARTICSSTSSIRIASSRRDAKRHSTVCVHRAGLERIVLRRQRRITRPARRHRFPFPVENPFERAANAGGSAFGQNLNVQPCLGTELGQRFHPTSGIELAARRLEAPHGTIGDGHASIGRREKLVQDTLRRRGVGADVDGAAQKERRASDECQ